MESRWRVSRTFVPYLDGERRWDYAYQFLVQWMAEREAERTQAPPNEQEASNGNCHVCPSIDGTTTTGSYH